MKALKILSVALAAIVVVTAFLLAIGMPVGFLASSIAERVEHETGYRLSVKGSTKVGLWPSLNVIMNDVTLEQKERDTGGRLTVASIQADITLASLWSGHPDVSELVLDHPALSVPLRRERRPAAKTTAQGTADTSAPTVRRIVVTDGMVSFFNTHDHVESHVEGISARAAIDADRRLSLNGNARAGGYPLTFNVKAVMPDPSLQRQTIPLELTLDAPGLLQATLSSKADIRLSGALVMINGISGSIGDGVFDGWASVDFASKPLVKLDIDFRRLDIATTTPQGTALPAQFAWSNEPLDLNGLNYVDAQFRLSAAELNIGSAHFAPVALEAALSGGALKGSIANIGAYGGQANGTLNIDVSFDTPVYAAHADLNGVRALPLLSAAAGFDKLDGRLQAKIDVRSNGQTQQAIMSNLAGNVVADFRDGAIRGVNVAQMIRSLTSGTLSGWQEGQDKTTDLTQLSASFRIEKGQANTADLNLVGPLVKMTGTGAVDLGAKRLTFRVEPKLVLTTEGQGRASDPVGFGIPVVVDGPWDAPRIYPDVAGILDNPDAAYSRLKEMGAGLFAPGGPGSTAPGDNGLSDTLGKTIGTLLQQGLGADQNRTNPSSPAPNTPSAPTPNSSPQPAQGAPAVNDILKQLFGR